MSDKIIRTLFMLFVFTGAFACSTLSPNSAPTPTDAEIEKEEQAVYSFFVGGQGGTTLILQETSTSVINDDPQTVMDNIKSGLTGISNETVKNFIARNAQPTQLSTDMNLGTKYTLITSEELSKITKQPNWGEILANTYPGSNGYLIISRVGFNNTLDQAVIYVGQVAGPMMGSGSYYLMEKQNGNWIIKQEVMVWIS